MPERADSFGEGILEILTDAIQLFLPNLMQTSRVCLGICAIVLLLSVLQGFSSAVRIPSEIGGTVAIATMMLGDTRTLVQLGVQMISDLSEYGKLLLPVMTTAMAAQGGFTSSTALFTGTTIFHTFLSSLVSSAMIPLIYMYLALAAANAALGEDLLKKGRDFIKWLMTWSLKIILYVFTGYMGITGVITGTTDAAALKATKIAISGVVPVVGGILSDASEAVLVGAGMIKNTAGIYGTFAMLAVFLGPFLKIAAHYLMLKLTAAVCDVFGSKRITDLIADFSTAMGMLLAATGSICLLLLIGTVSFLKGVS